MLTDHKQRKQQRKFQQQLRQCRVRFMLFGCGRTLRLSYVTFLSLYFYLLYVNSYYRPYSPGGRLTAFAPARKGSSPPTPSLHRLLRGLPGYLIPFAPHAFAPQRQGRPSWPPSPRVFLPISTHFTTTPGIPPTPADLKLASPRRPSPVEPGAFTSGLTSRLRALYAQ